MRNPFRRRLKQKIPTAVPDRVPSEVITPSPQNVLQHQRSYLSRLKRYLVVAFLGTLFFAACLYGSAALYDNLGQEWRDSIGLTGSPRNLAARVALDISIDQAISGLATLAALVIALQVSVRSLTNTEDAERALGRQRVLEDIAAFTAFGAYAIFFAAAAHFPPDGWLTRAGPLVGLLVGSTLIALLAADAASATPNQLNHDVGREQRSLTISQLRESVEKRNSRVSSTPSVFRPIALAVAIVTVGAGAVGLAVGIIAPAGYKLVAGILFSVAVAVYSLAAGTGVSLATYFAASRAYVFSAAVAVLTTGVTVGFAFSIFAMLRGLPAIGPASQTVLTVIAVTSVLLQIALLSGRVPGRHKKLSSSIGYQLVTRQLTIAIRRLEVEGSEKVGDEVDRASRLSMLWLVLAFVVPPVAAVLALVELIQAQSQRTVAPTVQTIRRLKTTILISIVLTIGFAVGSIAVVLGEFQ